MAIAKWFPNLTPETPLQRAAEVVLDARARAVLHFLKRVIKRPGKDPEDVHQLRVATRRLGAALSVFKECISTTDYRRLRHRSRKLRRAAGAVRDLDVQRSMIASRPATFAQDAHPQGKGIDQHLQAEKKREERKLLKLARATLDPFAREVARANRRLQTAPPGDPEHTAPFLAKARKIIRKRLKAVRNAGRKDLTDHDVLHQLRIAAKRLRYAMELFAGCFPTQFRHSAYAMVEGLQEELGHINDLRNLASVVRAFARKRSHRGRNHEKAGNEDFVIERDLQAELEREHSRFLQQWKGRAQKHFYRRMKKFLGK